MNDKFDAAAKEAAERSDMVSLENEALKEENANLNEELTRLRKENKKVLGESEILKA